METCPCGAAHGPFQVFYVSVIDGPRLQCLLGPLATHEQALAMVGPVKARAQELDPKAVFYAFGTVGRTDTKKPGILNHLFPEVEILK